MNSKLRYLLDRRQQGNTQALVSVLKTNPDAKLLVHSYAFKKALMREENLRQWQVITVNDLTSGTIGNSGPILVDIPVIPYLTEPEPSIMNKDFKLCYIDKYSTAYFTTHDLDKQWGDDWDDAPYEHNAGPPYEPTIFHYVDGRKEKDPRDWNEDGTPKFELYHLKFDAGWRLDTPASRHYNSPYSVQMINAGAVAWLSGTDTDGKPIAIQAGASIEEFKQKVKQAGGNIYILEE